MLFLWCVALRFGVVGCVALRGSEWERDGEGGARARKWEGQKDSPQKRLGLISTRREKVAQATDPGLQPAKAVGRTLLRKSGHGRGSQSRIEHLQLHNARDERTNERTSEGEGETTTTSTTTTITSTTAAGDGAAHADEEMRSRMKHLWRGTTHWLHRVGKRAYRRAQRAQARLGASC
ncbi:hypothetical protein AXG93_2767s1120 [Marchantia polymorpha subsp. ruderalis]|uniref:Secreted protein n=1 Tax=Marchantia polymorpha subsp. ruderalis TaxID=1480154 RepID=A0A176VW68_MARPO|nr:hypothetical protein AXG93_2767s1120 [Marchantia polymorpha subsp. ruderalis]